MTWFPSLKHTKPVPGSGDAKVPRDTDEVMVGVGGVPEAPEPHRQDRGPVQPSGPLPVEAHEHEEASEVNGVKLTEESSLKDLRTACRYLHISKNGAKALVWARLKKEVAMLRLKTSVECSDAVKAEYEREPVAQSLPTKPSPDLVALHEITQNSPSEDAFSSSGDPGRRRAFVLLGVQACCFPDLPLYGP